MMKSLRNVLVLLGVVMFAFGATGCGLCPLDTNGDGELSQTEIDAIDTEEILAEVTANPLSAADYLPCVGLIPEELLDGILP